MDNIDELIRQLRSPVFSSRPDALHELSNAQDPRAIDAIVETLEDADSALRDSAAEILGKLKSPRAVDALLRAVQDPNDWRLREYTAWALGEIGDPRAGDALLPLLQEGTGDVIDAARHALVKLGDKRIVPRFIKDPFHPKEWVRNISARLLGEIGDETALAQLEQLQATHINVRHELDVRRTAGEAMAQIRRRTTHAA